MISILLSSVIFRANDVLITTLIKEFQPGGTWLTDEHLNFLHLMLYQKCVRPPSGKILTLSDKTIISDMFFYTMLQTDSHTAINLLETLLLRHNLYNVNKCTAKEMLFPVNLSYGHWILIYVGYYNRAFYPMNPYRPTNPSPSEIHLARSLYSYPKYTGPGIGF